MPEKEIAARLVEMSVPGFWAGLGAGCNFLYKVSQGMPFRFSLFVLNVFLGFSVGMITGQFLDASLPYRDGVVAVCGLSTLHILGFLEHGGWRYAANIFLRAFRLPELPKAMEEK